MSDLIIGKGRRNNYIFYGSKETKDKFDEAILNYYNTLPGFLKVEENNKINNEMTEVLYVKLTDVPKTDTRKDFIRKFIRGKFASYSNEDCTKLQCDSGRFRSITELHQIVLSRFPKTSFEAIIRIVRDLINEENPFTMVYCTTVEKVVLKYLGKATSSYISDYSRNNYYTVKGTDGYSLCDYEQLINKI